MKIELYTSKSDKAWEYANFSTAAIVGDTIYLSGVIGRTENETAHKTAADEFKDTWNRISNTLTECGSDISQTVEILSFHVKTDEDTIAAFLAVKDEYFGSHKPAWTAVGTNWLAIEGARAEVKVVAKRNQC